MPAAAESHAPPLASFRVGSVPEGNQFFRLADEAPVVGLRQLNNPSREPAIRIESLVE